MLPDEFAQSGELGLEEEEADEEGEDGVEGDDTLFESEEETEE